MHNPQIPIIDFCEYDKFPELWGNDLIINTQVWRRAERLHLNTPITQRDLLELVGFEGGCPQDGNLEVPLEAATPEPASTPSASNVDTWEPYEVVGRSNLILDFACLPAPQATRAKAYVLVVVGCRNVVIRNLHLSTLESSGIYIGESAHVTIEHCSFHKLTNSGIVIGAASHHIEISNNTFTACAGAGIFVGEASRHIVIEGNTIVDGTGKSNWTAGIVLTDRHGTDLRKSVDTIFGPDGYWASPIPIFDRDLWVGACRIVNNTICGNLASGVYIDGALDNILLSNFVSNNSKEGICLDYGATRNVVCFNSIQLNGNRFGKTDEDLARDFVLHHGRCEDGTPSAKVPGISLDNALLNLVQYNWFIGNFGSGIKLVRSSFLNSAAYNVVAGNNVGMNARNHFFGVELGAAVSDVATRDGIPMELDFLPSGYNLIYRNIIYRGHFSGIFLDRHTQGNILYDNSIHDNREWSMEAVDSPGANVSLNNFSTQNSRHIGLSRAVNMTVGLGQAMS